jgi:hypothetical protein
VISDEQTLADFLRAKQKQKLDANINQTDQKHTNFMILKVISSQHIPSRLL